MGKSSAAGGPSALSDLRRRHRAIVLAEIHRRGAVSRTDVCRSTGLSRTTVSGIASELLAEGLVVGQPDRRAPQGSGRPATLLSLRRGNGSLLGVHFAHDRVRVGLADLSGQLVDVRQTLLDMDHHAADALAFAEGSLAELAQTAGASADGQPLGPAVGVGVALSGPTRAGRPVTTGGLLPDWAGIDVAERLEATTGLPVHVGNDANLGALAEWTHGSGRGAADLVYVMLSDGVGSGLVLDGRLYEGSSGVAGELGHVVVVPGGVVCRCGGRGCLETVAGSPALVAALRPARGPATTFEAVIEWARTGDPGASRVLGDAGRAVGLALAGVCAMLDVGLVVVGGRGGAAGEPLLSAIRESLTLGVPPAISREVRVVAGELGADAELIGAVTAAGHVTAVPTLLAGTV